MHPSEHGVDLIARHSKDDVWRYAIHLTDGDEILSDSSDVGPTKPESALAVADVKRHWYPCLITYAKRCVGYSSQIDRCIYAKNYLASFGKSCCIDVSVVVEIVGSELGRYGIDPLAAELHRLVEGIIEVHWLTFGP